MPTRKQRRRREKSFRHEYGFVTYDEDGNEVELEGAQLRAQKETPAKPAKSDGKSDGKSSSKPRRSRDPEPPTWQRSLRRGALWSPATVALSLVVFHSATLPLRIVIGLAYAAMFVPLTYWMDGLVYRRYAKRKAMPPPRPGRNR